MSQSDNVAIAQRLLSGIRDQLSPDDIAVGFAGNLLFEIQGDDGVLPWIGRKHGRQALVDFIREMRVRTVPVSFQVEDIAASDRRAVIVGSLVTKIISTDRNTASQFAIILTVDDGTVIRFQMLEDSFDVSNAARNPDARCSTSGVA